MGRKVAGRLYVGTLVVSPSEPRRPFGFTERVSPGQPVRRSGIWLRVHRTIGYLILMSKAEKARS